MKFSIGIDFGDGDCCVVLKSEDSTVEPRVIQIGGGNSFLSAVATDSLGNILIGEEAFTHHDAINKRVRFKSHFRDNTEDARTAFGLFIKEVIYRVEATLAEEKKPTLNSGEYTVVVGCPAAWDATTRNIYSQLLNAAGIANPVLVSESRGALMYGVESSEFGLSADAAVESTLIIDLGSSTLDYAWVSNHQDHAVAGDARLGGGLFDEYILKNAVQRAPDPQALADMLERYPDWRNVLLLDARRLKERYFSHEELYAKDGCSDAVTIYADGKQKVELSISGADMWQNIATRSMKELGNESFVSCLCNSLAKVREQTGENPPRYILLTGGASRMEFFRDECARAFPEAKILLSKQPETCIAKGLAYCGFEDASARACAAELRAYVDGDAVETLVKNQIGTLYTRLADELIPVINNNMVLPEFRRWRAGSIQTLNGMEQQIKAKIPAVMQSAEMKKRIENLTAQWTTPIVQQAQTDVDAICLKHHIKLKGKLSLIPKSLEVGRGTIDGPSVDFSFLQAIIGTVVTIVIATISGGAGMALIAGGPLGIILGAIIGIVAYAVGKDAATEYLKDRDIWPMVRKLITEGQITTERNIGKMKDSLIAELKQRDMGQQIIDQLSGGIDAEIKKIVATELQMD